ncbi:MAG: ABC transporter ATP-binding protein [Betaproteobacteria bacterium]|nr:ABC transporter ATP-binding protein [Betaproteobacteria bacterium]
MLSIRDLEVYYGRAEAVRGVSLDVPKGEIVALLGINGAGKTTLLSAVAGLVRSAKGSVTLDGELLTGLRPEYIVRRGVALVPERRDLFPEMSVAENLEMGAYLRRDRAAVRADMKLIYGYFPVLEPRRQQLASTLSGGQQQMLAIGRALMSRPRYLLLDEPSLGLSPVMLEAIFEIIERINREEGTTVFLVEQNTRVALSVARRGYVLENGMVVASGTSEELLDSDLVRHSYLGGAQ